MCRVLADACSIYTTDDSRVANRCQRHGCGLSDRAAMAVSDGVTQADRTIIVGIRREGESIRSITTNFTVTGAQPSHRQLVTTVDVCRMFQKLCGRDLHRLVLSAAGKRDRAADRGAIVAAGDGDDEVFCVARSCAVGHGDGNGHLFRRACREMLVGCIGRIKAPGTVRVQRKARRRRLTQRVGLRIARIHIRGRHLTRHGCSVFRRRRRRRAQNRCIIRTVDRNLNLMGCAV